MAASLPKEHVPAPRGSLTKSPLPMPGTPTSSSNSSRSSGSSSYLSSSNGPPLSLSMANSSFDDYGVTPPSFLSDEEIQACVARLQAALSQGGNEAQGDDNSNGSPLPEGFLLQCLRSRSGVEKEALMVARNFLAFRRGAGWPLRLQAREVSGGPLESGAHWVLPGKDKEGRGLFVFNVGKIDVRQGSLESFQKMGAYVVERVTRDEAIQTTGLVMIVNLAQVPFSLYRALVSLQDAKRGVRMWQDAFPCKLKRIYVVGGGTLLLQAMRLVVALLGKKLRNRVRVLTSLEALREDVDGDQLPPSLGGGMADWEWGRWVETAQAEEAEGEDVDRVWGEHPRG